MADANSVNAGGQAEKPFRIAVKMRLAELEITVTELAERLGLERNTVSLAINQERMMPGVKARITAELDRIESAKGVFS